MTDPSEQEGWEKLRRLAEKHRASDDPDISKALEGALVAEARDLAKAATLKPEWLREFPLVAGFFAALPEEDRADQNGPPDPSDRSGSSTTILSEEALPNDVEAAERLIREAHIASIRGDKAKAKELLDQAEKAAPRSAAVLVALGDAALERHNVKEAVRLYAIAKDVEPKNVAIEKKHADAVFRQTQGLVFDPYAKPGTITDAASAKAAVVMSFMCPGLGQIVTGDTVKGAVFLAGFAGCVIAITIMGLNGFFEILGMRPDKPGNPNVVIFIALGALIWLSAIMDASAKAKRSDRPKINRPPPPGEGGNLPFE